MASKYFNSLGDMVSLILQALLIGQYFIKVIILPPRVQMFV